MNLSQRLALCLSFFLSTVAVYLFTVGPAAAAGGGGAVTPPAGEAAKSISAVAAEPATAGEFLARGKKRLESREIKGAEADFRQAAARDPKSVAALLALADLCEGTGRGEEAVTVGRKGLELEPKNLEMNRFMAECLDRLQRYQEAVECWKVVIELDPKNPLPHVYLGFALGQAKHPEQTRAEYDKAIAIDPKCALAYYNRGVLEMLSGEGDKAIQDFLKAAELDPQNANAAYNAGQYYYNQGRFADARTQWLRAHQVEPANTQTLRKIIQTFYAEKKYAEAGPYRDEILRQHQESQDPEERKTRFFCIDQFKVGDLLVLANEIFDKSDDLYYHYSFWIYDAKQQYLRKINLESSAVIREMGTPYVMGCDLPDGTHTTYTYSFKKLPDYATVKELVVKLIKENPPAATSSKRDAKGNVTIETSPATKAKP